MIPLATTGGRPRRQLLAALSAALVLAVTGVAACRSTEPEPPGPVDAETYVQVMSELADLQRFPPPGPDAETRQARADSARRVILDRHGVTADELLEFAEHAGREPARMLEITDRIVRITDSLARARTGAGRAAERAADSVRRDTSPAPTP